MTERPAPAKRRVSALTVATAVIVVLVAGALIAFPYRSGSGRGAASRPVQPEISTIDPAALVPGLAELPQGASIQSSAYITTEQAAKRNSTSLDLLRQTGREIGYDRDFLVPRYADIEVEVVRFRSHQGMGRAYAYFLGLPGAQGLHPTVFRGLGEKAALVTSPQAGFVEFMRGRYYAVITAVPLTQSTLDTIGALARRLDTRIRHYQPNA